MQADRHDRGDRSRPGSPHLQPIVGVAGDGRIPSSDATLLPRHRLDVRER